MKLLSIIAYCFIFLQGSMILMPVGCMLVFGLFESEPVMRLLIALADISLIGLVIISFKEKSKWTLSLEIACFLGLLSPLVRVLIKFSFEWFNYFAFLFPFICFVILFPLSIYLSYKKMNVVKDIQRLA